MVTREMVGLMFFLSQRYNILFPTKYKETSSECKLYKYFVVTEAYHELKFLPYYSYDKNNTNFWWLI